MAFSYQTPPSSAQQTPTFESKSMLVKSFLVNVATGSPFLTATTYTLGRLPKGSQVVFANLVVPTAVSGGTVSAATVVVTVGGANIFNGTNVFTAGATSMTTSAYYSSLNSVVTGPDQAVNITPTLTGAGATAGIMYINVFYVV